MHSSHQQHTHRVIAFIAFIALLLGTITPATLRADEGTSPPIEQMRAFWAASYNEGFRNAGEVDELISNVVRANANTVIVQMRRHGDAWYNRSFEPRAADPGLEVAEAFDPLDDVIRKGHEHGVQVHAWLVVSVACRSQDALRGHPNHVCTLHGPDIVGTESWTTFTYEGESVGDLDFGHPSAVHYMERVVANIVQQYPDLDGIHFDFIRYSGKEYGYNPVSVDRFNREYGLPPENRPHPHDEAWSQWRRERMTELMRRLYIRAKAIKPTIQMSVAAVTWGGSGNYSLEDFDHSAAYTNLFQDWRAWLQEGIIDFALPMHYFDEGIESNRSWYDGWLAWDRAHTGKRAIVAGLGSWLNTDTQNIAQVQRALAPNSEGRVLSGVAFYAYHNLFIGCNPHERRIFMDMLREGVFAQPARPPQWQWVFQPTTGMLQGIATVNGEIVPHARVSLVKDGVWQRDMLAAVDGWYGAVDIEPGTYVLAVFSPQGEWLTQYDNIVITPGNVTSGS